MDEVFFLSQGSPERMVKGCGVVGRVGVGDGGGYKCGGRSHSTQSAIRGLFRLPPPGSGDGTGSQVYDRLLYLLSHLACPLNLGVVMLLFLLGSRTIILWAL